MQSYRITAAEKGGYFVENHARYIDGREVASALFAGTLTECLDFIEQEFTGKEPGSLPTEIKVSLA